MSKQISDTDMKDWLNKMPSVFPECMDYFEENTVYQNPVIGNTQAETHKNVCEVLSFFSQMAQPTHTEKARFSLDENSTWGFVIMLECITGALKFEEKHRHGGGVPVKDEPVG